MSDPTGPTSFSSGWAGSFAIGKVFSINDRGNRLQVRIHGYQDDKGNIPDEQLEWIGTIDAGAAQIAGASKTHSYFPGSHVAVAMIGNQKFIIGAVTGYDSDQTNKKNSGADTSENQDPNIPKQARGEGEQYEGNAEDKTAKGSRNVTKTDEPYDPPQDEKSYDHSKQRAPYDQGTQSKFAEKMSIAIDKLAQGSDILNVIEQLDGNISGAIQSATQLIRNLRNNGFGKALDVVGSGALAAAGAQHDSYFQPSINSNLLSLIQQLLAANAVVAGTNVSNIKANAQSHALDIVISSFSNQQADVDPDTINNIQSVIDRVSIAVGNVPTYYGTEVGILKSNFNKGMTEAVHSIMNTMTQLADTAGGSGGLITLMGGPASFQQVCAGLSSLASTVSIPPTTLYALGNGVVGIALQNPNDLTALSQAQQNNNTAGGGGGGNSPANMIQALIGNMNMFQGNKIALGENGSINPQTLSGIAIKYAKKQINDPQKTFFGS